MPNFHRDRIPTRHTRSLPLSSLRQVSAKTMMGVEAETSLAIHATSRVNGFSLAAFTRAEPLHPNLIDGGTTMANLIAVLSQKCWNASRALFVQNAIEETHDLRNDRELFEAARRDPVHGAGDISCRYTHSTLRIMKGVEQAPDCNYNSYSNTK